MINNIIELIYFFDNYLCNHFSHPNTVSISSMFLLFNGFCCLCLVILGFYCPKVLNKWGFAQNIFWTFLSIILFFLFYAIYFNVLNNSQVSNYLTLYPFLLLDITNFHTYFKVTVIFKIAYNTYFCYKYQHQQILLYLLLVNDISLILIVNFWLDVVVYDTNLVFNHIYGLAILQALIIIYFTLLDFCIDLFSINLTCFHRFIFIEFSFFTSLSCFFYFMYT